MTRRGDETEKDHEHPLDHAAMNAVVGGDRELLREIATLFSADLPEMLARLRETAARGGGEPLWKAAHTVKGAVTNFGAHAAAAKAKALEDAVRAGAPVEKLRALADELDQEALRVQRALEALLAED